MATPLPTLSGHLSHLRDVLDLVARQLDIHHDSASGVDSIRLQIARMQVAESAERVKIAHELVGRVADNVALAQVEGRA